ncbi:HAD family hydrolase [Gordonia soli]|uniref:Phosphoserine phosphatase n=1 Tax=Gordonia soli NBRC 108243 TaxID=1223545 RepID=M0QDA7_9ACTN|nr:HAD-IB family phosphatase [Gordonia soli]GAC66603.1 phosphoserine phosphatase [Gordonia soli NBRC 108243]
MEIRGIVFFDIDGTLIPSMSSGSFLASRLGHQRQLDRAERRYATGELTNEQVSVIDAKGWRGVRTAVVDRWLDDLPLISGIETVVAWCRDKRVEPVLASLAWQPVSNSIARRHGFTPNGGPRVGVTDGAFDGTVAEHFDEYDKRDKALELAAARGVPPLRCCAVGDSRSDIPLFDALPSSLALNAGTVAQDAATDTLDTTDLIDMLPWLEAWIRTVG